MRYLTYLAFISILLTGCLGNNQNLKNNTPNNLNQITSSSTPQKPLFKEKNTIEITANGFVPNNYTVRLGTTVKWINNDNAPHIVRFLDKFQSPTLKKNEGYSYTFEQTGEYFFDCAIHTYLKGRIIVEE